MSQYSNLILSLFLGSILATGCSSNAQTNEVTVDANHEGFIFRPNSYGVDTTIAYNEGIYTLQDGEEMLQYSLQRDSLQIDRDYHLENDSSYNIKATVHYKISRGQASKVHLELGRQYHTYVEDLLVEVCELQLIDFDISVINVNTIGRLEPLIGEHMREKALRRGLSIMFIEIQNLESLL
ncbi:MAG: hypothetical protein ACI9J3_001714 [Parvicellaceae bacterium]|jgi:hypothetical protein